MTIKEMNDRLWEHCKEHICNDCEIFKSGLDEAHSGHNCIGDEDWVVERNYMIVFGDKEQEEVEEDTCGNCKHTNKTEEEYPCMACNRNYSYTDEAHWKHSDRWEPAKDEKQKENENTPSIEEMNAVIQKHCMNTNDCAECPLEKMCVSIDGIYSDHPVECAIAYKYLQGFAAPHTDAVNHPAHYQGKYECIDEMIALFGRHAVMDFCRCNVYKYRYRAAAKNGQEDLDKANWYMDKLIELQGKETA